MNLRMTTALWRNGVVTLDDVKENFQVQNNLRCVCCKRVIKYYSEYIRSDGIKVRHSFRAPWGHKENCKYNGKAKIKRIANNSNGLLTENLKGRHQFRIDIVTEEIKQHEKKLLQYKQTDNTFQINRNNYYSQNNRLISYLKTMKNIMKLKEQIESDDNDGSDGSIRGVIQLSMGSQKVNWSNFYYQTNQLMRCFNYCSKNKSHPICIQGIYQVKKIEKENPYYMLKLDRPYVKENQVGIKQIPNAEYYIFDKSIVDFIQSEQEKGKNKASIFSFVECRKSPVRGEGNDKYQFLDIRGRINNKHQLYIF